MRTLLYGSRLPAKYWLSALLHAVYLHNQLVHEMTKRTPFEGFYQLKPNLSHLKVFGSCVCVKCKGKHCGKLDQHNFKGVFLGITSTNHNIVYIDLNSGLVKTLHHTQFDEAWYLQATRPPAAQLLFDLGVEADVNTTPDAPQYLEPLQTNAPFPQCKNQNSMIPLGLSQPNANSSPCHYGTQHHHQFNKRLQLHQPGPRQLPPHQKPQTPQTLAPIDAIR
jgi:hypothetical protein